MATNRIQTIGRKEKIVKLIDTISRVMNYVASIIIIIMMMLVVSDVFLRFAFNRPIMGTTELTELMLASLVFLGLGWAAASKAHIEVNLLTSRLSPKVQAIVDSITYSAGLILCVIIVWQSLRRSIAVLQSGLTTTLLHVPLFPFFWIVAFGYAILCLVMTTHLIQHLFKVFKE